MSIFIIYINHNKWGRYAVIIKVSPPLQASPTPPLLTRPPFLAQPPQRAQPFNCFPILPNPSIPYPSSPIAVSGSSSGGNCMVRNPVENKGTLQVPYENKKTVHFWVLWAAQGACSLTTFLDGCLGLYGIVVELLFTPVCDPGRLRKQKRLGWSLQPWREITWEARSLSWADQCCWLLDAIQVAMAVGLVRVRMK